MISKFGNVKGTRLTKVDVFFQSQLRKTSSFSVKVMSVYDEDLRIWRGPVRNPLYDTRSNLGELLMFSLEKNPEKIVQINAESGVSVTSEEIRLKSIRVANALKQMGFKTGDIMMLAARNHPDICPALFGCFIIGAPVNAVDINFSKDDIAHMIRLLRPKMIFCDFDVFDKMNEALDEAEHKAHFVTFNNYSDKALFIDQLYRVYCDEDNFKFPDLGDTSKLPVVIMCSSGTTGLPKGVCLSHTQMIDQVQKYPKRGSSDICLVFSSLYWISGMATTIHSTLVGYKRVVTTEPFTPTSFFDIIENYQITAIFGSPVMMMVALRHPDVFITDFSSIKNIYIGGGIVTAELKRTVERVCKIRMIVVYGMTETAGIISYNRDYEEPDGTVGIMADNMSGRIVDKEGNNLEPNGVGEVHIYCKNQFLGYINNEAATKEALLDDGWLRTGDLGFFDDHGYLHIIGRDKDTIKYMGHQISPSEIEMIIQQIRGVVMCCVVGVPDEVYGDLPAAAVIKLPGSEVTEDDVKDAVATKLSDFKHLRGGVYFVDSLPRTVSGKVKTNVVRDMLTHLYQQKTTEE